MTEPAMAAPASLLVVGGGIAGLAAAPVPAWPPDCEVTVLEASGRLGGKLRSGTWPACSVDVGAEAILARRPEGVELAQAVGPGRRTWCTRPPTAAGGLEPRRAAPAALADQLMGVPGGPGARWRQSACSARARWPGCGRTA